MSDKLAVLQVTMLPSSLLQDTFLIILLCLSSNLVHLLHGLDIRNVILPSIRVTLYTTIDFALFFLTCPRRKRSFKSKSAASSACTSLKLYPFANTLPQES